MSDFRTTIMDDVELDGETNWHYYHSRDDQWDHLVSCWHETKAAYFRHIKTNDVMVCAGGHVGIYARFYMRTFKRVYVFEPHPQSFVCLVNNTSNENVIKIQAALGNKNQLISLYGPAKMALQVSEDGGFIPTFTIDNLALDACSAIQLDVENSEYAALLGAENTIEKYKPIIILENGETEQIVDLLTKKNYSIKEKVQYDTIWTYNE